MKGKRSLGSAENLGMAEITVIKEK